MNDKQTVYAFANVSFGEFRDQAWIAIAEDGEVLAQHVSSSRSWGQRDVGPDGFHRDRYAEKFGPDFAEHINYVVLPQGEAPPDEVYERNQARAAAEDAGAQP